MELADMAWKIFSPPKKSPEKLTRIHSGVCFFLALVICGHLNAPMHLGAEEIAVMVNPVVKIAGDILTICCVFSHQQHHAVLFRGNKWNTVNAAAICVGSVICPARPHRFLWRFYSPPPFILISPVMTAALPSPSFRAGWVHRDERSVGRWIDWCRWARGSGTASVRRRERIEVANDKRMGDETRPLKRNSFLPQCFIIYFSFFCVEAKEEKKGSTLTKT